MMRQTSDAMVKSIGVKIQAKRPAFPMMAVVVLETSAVCGTACSVLKLHPNE